MLSDQCVSPCKFLYEKSYHLFSWMASSPPGNNFLILIFHESDQRSVFRKSHVGYVTTFNGFCSDTNITSVYFIFNGLLLVVIISVPNSFLDFGGGARVPRSFGDVERKVRLAFMWHEVKQGLKDWHVGQKSG